MNQASMKRTRECSAGVLNKSGCSGNARSKYSAMSQLSASAVSACSRIGTVLNLPPNTVGISVNPRYTVSKGMPLCANAKRMRHTKGLAERPFSSASSYRRTLLLPDVPMRFPWCSTQACYDRQTMSTRPFTSDEEIAAIGRGVLDLSLPKPRWTHAAHFATALWLIACRHDLDASRDMPGFILASKKLSCLATT